MQPAPVHNGAAQGEHPIKSLPSPTNDQQLLPRVKQVQHAAQASLDQGSKPRGSSGDASLRPSSVNPVQPNCVQLHSDRRLAAATADGHGVRSALKGTEEQLYEGMHTSVQHPTGVPSTVAAGTAAAMPSVVTTQPINVTLSTSKQRKHSHLKPLTAEDPDTPKLGESPPAAKRRRYITLDRSHA